MRRLLIALPLFFFLALAALFYFRLGAGDPSQLPSVLVGKPAPTAALPPLEGLIRDGKPVPGFDPAKFQGNVTIVNVWASWCVPCRDEAAQLLKLSADKRFRIAGINYKDETENARRFLGRFGAYKLSDYVMILDGTKRDDHGWQTYGSYSQHGTGPTGVAFEASGSFNARW